VYNFCLNYLRNLEDAEEVTQDVFVRVYQKIDTFNNQSQLSTWIYRITLNCCIDLIKSKNRKKRFGFLTSLFNHETNEVLPEAENFSHPGVDFEQQEAVARIFKLIDLLPANQKAVLLFAKIEQKTIREIAPILEISEKAAESLLFRAKENLAKKLNASE
jgi:RNA polymerase sigma-70 factor (ECF subfamily)